MGQIANSNHRITLRSEEHTSELQSLTNLVCRLLLAKKKPAGAGARLRLLVVMRGCLNRSFAPSASPATSTLSLHDALPILRTDVARLAPRPRGLRALHARRRVS